jgi:PhnB protein
MIKLNPYLAFKDNTRQAMEFYQSVFGGELGITTFKEGHMSQNSSEENLIMHAQLTAPNGIFFMASDTPSSMEYKSGANISMSLSGDDEALLRGYWDTLADGAQITLPLEKAPWGDIFGMLTDRFGIAWMVNIIPAKS